MRKLYVLTAEEFDRIRSIEATEDRVAEEMSALFEKEPFPGPAEIAEAFGYAKGTLIIAASDLRRIIREAAEVHNQDLLDGLTECAAGPHFYNPETLPDWCADKDYCEECQPRGKVEA